MHKLIVIVGFSLTMGGCSDGCRNTVISQAESPGQSHVATMFQRDCGATTGFSTQISIIDVDDQPHAIGNTFRADDDHGAARAGSWGGPWAEMKWLSTDRLLISYAAKSRVFMQSRQVSGVTISYRVVSH